MKRAGGSVATLALLVAAVTFFRPDMTPESDGPVVRDGDARAAPTTIAVHAPLGQAATTAIEFAWQTMGTDVRYRFNLTRADGSAVWNGGTSDTTLTLPPDVSLTPGATYFWWVDALMVDGRSVTTGMQSLEVVP